MRTQTVIDVCFPQLDGTVFSLNEQDFPRSLLTTEGRRSHQTVTDVNWLELKKTYTERLELFLKAAEKAGKAEAVIPPPNAFLSALRNSKTNPEGITDDLYAKKIFAMAVSELNGLHKTQLVIACQTREQKQVEEGILAGNGEVTILLNADMNSYRGQNNDDNVAVCNMGHYSHAMGNAGYGPGAKNAAEEAIARVSGGTLEAVCDNDLKFSALRKRAGLTDEKSQDDQLDATPSEDDEVEERRVVATLTEDDDAEKPREVATPSASLYFKIISGVVAAASAAALIVGVLAALSIITSIAPPVGLAMAGVGLTSLLVSGFFACRDSNSKKAAEDQLFSVSRIY